MDNNIHAGHRQRLRNRIQQEGLDNLLDYQILEYLLSFVLPRRDTNPLAHALINDYGSLSNVLDASFDSLIKVKGIGEVVASFITSLKPLLYAYQNSLSKKITYIKNTQNAIDFLNNVFKNKVREELFVVCLDNNCNIINTQKLNSGSSNQVVANIRQINEIANKFNTHNVLIAHNHPNGSSKPSIEDNKFTKALTISLYLSNIFLLDHIIVGSHDYYSYNLENKIDNYKKEIDTIINPILAQNKAPYNEAQND